MQRSIDGAPLFQSDNNKGSYSQLDRNSSPDGFKQDTQKQQEEDVGISTHRKAVISNLDEEIQNNDEDDIDRMIELNKHQQTPMKSSQNMEAFNSMKEMQQRWENQMQQMHDLFLNKFE